MSLPLKNAPETPFLAVDLDIMENNLSRAAEDAVAKGIALRPHAKTHKMPEIARRQLAHGAIGLTLATVSEAEVFADAGIDDIFVAYPVWPSEARAARIRELTQRVTLRIGVDSIEGAEALGAALPRDTVEVLIEVDSGHHRSGVQPEDAGSKVLGADRAAWATGYGRLLDVPDARIHALSEHHATIRFPDDMAIPGLGSTVRIIPNHVCNTVNLADEVIIIRDGDVVDAWTVAARGANT